MQRIRAQNSKHFVKNTLSSRSPKTSLPHKRQSDLTKESGPCPRLKDSQAGRSSVATSLTAASLQFNYNTRVAFARSPERRGSVSGEGGGCATWFSRRLQVAQVSALLQQNIRVLLKVLPRLQVANSCFLSSQKHFACYLWMFIEEWRSQTEPGLCFLLLSSMGCG